MKLKTWFGVAMVSGIMAAMLSVFPSTARAEMFSEAYNGATCISYPPYNTSIAVPYQHWLYGFGGMAFCHFPVPNGWLVDKLSYVLFEGSSPSASAPVHVRLCVSSYSSTAVTCGTEATMSGTSAVNWVALPSPMPSSAATAFLSVSFPSGVSTLQHFYPVWYRP